MYKLIITLAATVLLTNTASAWVEPQPGQEIPAPVNTSSQEQTKLGILDVGNWIKVLTNPFNFNIGVQAPKFCIQKPDGTTSCCPPAAGQDWSACSAGGGVNSNAKWVWNSVVYGNYANLDHFPQLAVLKDQKITAGAFDLVAADPSGVLVPTNTICRCSINAALFSYTWRDPKNPSSLPYMGTVAHVYYPNTVRAAGCKLSPITLAPPYNTGPYKYTCSLTTPTEFPENVSSPNCSSSNSITIPACYKDSKIYTLPSCAESCAGAYPTIGPSDD